MKIFVTGGAGFIGTHFCIDAQQRGHQTFVWDRVFGHEVNPGGSHKEALNFALESFLPDWVVHLAATPGVANGHKVAIEDVVCAGRLLEACDNLAVPPKILFMSTGSVYGRQWQFPTIEGAQMRPQEGFYATGKLAVEGLLSSWSGQRPATFQDVPRTAVVLRLGTILGPGNNKGFTRDFVERLQQDPKQLTTWGDGKQVKSYLHVDDLVTAMWRVMSVPAGFDVFNVSHDKHASIRDCIPWVCEEMGVAPEIVYGTNASGGFGDIPVIRLSNAKLRGTGWAPTKSIEQAVRDNVRWLLLKVEKAAA